MAIVCSGCNTLYMILLLFSSPEHHSTRQSNKEFFQYVRQKRRALKTAPDDNVPRPPNRKVSSTALNADEYVFYIFWKF